MTVSIWHMVSAAFSCLLHSRMSKINHHLHQSILLLLLLHQTWCDISLYLLFGQMCEKNALWGLEFTKHRPPLGLQVAPPSPSPALLVPQDSLLHFWHPSWCYSSSNWARWICRVLKLCYIGHVAGSGWGREDCGVFLEWWSVFCVMPIPAYKSSALHCQHCWIQFSGASTAS